MQASMWTYERMDLSAHEHVSAGIDRHMQKHTERKERRAMRTWLGFSRLGRGDGAEMPPELDQPEGQAGSILSFSKLLEIGFCTGTYLPSGLEEAPASGEREEPAAQRSSTKPEAEDGDSDGDGDGGKKMTRCIKCSACMALQCMHA
jgi:hypothetical protein